MFQHLLLNKLHSIFPLKHTLKGQFIKKIYIFISEAGDTASNLYKLPSRLWYNSSPMIFAKKIKVRAITITVSIKYDTHGHIFYTPTHGRRCFLYFAFFSYVWVWQNICWRENKSNKKISNTHSSVNARDPSRWIIGESYTVQNRKSPRYLRWYQQVLTREDWKK